MPPQRRNHAAMRRRSNCSCDTVVVIRSPGVVVFEATGSPCRRLCLNGGGCNWNLYANSAETRQPLNFQVVSVTRIRSLAKRFIDVQIL
jgi:hypothetical protein